MSSSSEPSSTLTSPSSTPTRSWIVDAWRNFSSVRARQVTGTHILRVGGCSIVNRMVVRGESIDSPTFTAGGHKWKLSYYPNGDLSTKKSGRVTVVLKLMDRGFHGHITAAHRVSILGRDGRPAYSYYVPPQRYSGEIGYSHEFGSTYRMSSSVDVLVTAEDRKAALRLMGDDSLVVRCDVTVLKLEKESRLKWFLRKLLD
ncbi:hypothetical protein ACP70R_049578 [Stipagrostis hirtigluma subsp. patula]